MDNQPGADQQDQQNTQPARRLFVYDRPHAVQRSFSQPDQSQPTTPAQQPVPAPQLQPPAPAPHAQPPGVSVPGQPPVNPEPRPQPTPPESVPAPHQPPAPEDVALSHTPRPVRPQLPEHNFDQPDLVDLKPVWQVSLPEELTEENQPINQPYELPKKRLWQRAQTEPAPDVVPPQPNSAPALPLNSQPNSLPLNNPAPAAKPTPLAPPAPAPQLQPQPQRPEGIAFTETDQPAVTARIPDQATFNNQFAPQPKAKKSFIKRLVPSRVPSAMKLMAAMVLVAGAVVSFNAFQAKSQVSDSVANNPYKPGGSGVLGSSDETPKQEASAPSEEPLGDNFSMYRVEPGDPSKIIIPGIGTDTRVFSVGVDSSNIILPPDNINKIGWYEDSAQPGNQGVVILNGYIEGPSKRGALYGIEKLKQGNKITIERGDGVDLIYTVQAVESYDNDEIDMSKVSTPYVLGKKGLNIMTVGGRYDAESGQYEKRYAVFATEDGS